MLWSHAEVWVCLKSEIDENHKIHGKLTQWRIITRLRNRRVTIPIALYSLLGGNYLLTSDRHEYRYVLCDPLPLVGISALTHYCYRREYQYVAQNCRTIGVLAMSFLAMSVLVTWSRVVMSRDVMSRVFSAPVYSLCG